MLEIFQTLISTLIADPVLTAIVPVTSILTGPVDLTMETQASLLYPSIVLWLVGETSRTVPLYARDTQIQLDIWSRNSQLELETIYEQVLVDLNYLSGNQSTAHIFWERLGNAVDLFETDRRIWHRACTFVVWSTKP